VHVDLERDQWPDRCFLVELYLPRTAQPDLRDFVARADAGARELAQAGIAIRCVGGLFVPEDETCFLRYRGDSACAAAQAVRRAAIHFERVLEAREITRGGHDD
jgi:hypothetical protein